MAKHKERREKMQGSKSTAWIITNELTTFGYLMQEHCNIFVQLIWFLYNDVALKHANIVE